MHKEPVTPERRLRLVPSLEVEDCGDAEKVAHDDGYLEAREAVVELMASDELDAGEWSTALLEFGD